MRMLFAKLYYRWYGEGQAYNGPLWYDAAELIKRLAGPDCLRVAKLDYIAKVAEKEE